MAPPRGLTPEQLTETLGRLAQEKVWRDEMRRTYRPLGIRAARDVRAEMRSGSDRRLAAAARAVSGRSYPDGAAVAVTAGARVPHALATVWGRKGRRTGWNLFDYSGPGQVNRVRRVRAASALSQHPLWVGQAWRVATRGEGPRGLNDALADHQGDYVDEFAAMSMGLIIRALPASAR